MPASRPYRAAGEPVLTGRAGTRSAPRPGPGRARPAPGRAHAVSGAATTGQGGATAPAPPTANARPYAAGPWPLRESLELGALPGAVPCARLHARQILWEWALTPLTEAVRRPGQAGHRAGPPLAAVRFEECSGPGLGRRSGAAGADRARRGRGKRPGPVPRPGVQRPLGVIRYAAPGRQGGLGAVWRGCP